MKAKLEQPEFAGNKQSVVEMLGLTVWRVAAALTITLVVAGTLIAWAQMKRMSSYQATCASNLRQLGVAMFQYAQDNDQGLPCPGGKNIGSWNDIDADGSSPVLDPYLSKSRQDASLLWSCPRPISHPSVVPPTDDENYYLRYPRTYAMNTFLRSPGTMVFDIKHGKAKVTDVDAVVTDGSRLRDLPTTIKLSGIPDPAHTDLLFEGIPVSAPTDGEDAEFDGFVKGYGAWNSLAGFYRSDSACSYFISKKGERSDESCQDPGLGPWHGNSDNFLYCDGHVRPHKPVQQGWRASRDDPGDFYVTHCRVSGAPCP